jgi:hypothetical protein
MEKSKMKANSFSVLGVGPVFKEHRTHAFFGQDERPV